jgi:hypothetical protein
MDKVIPAKTNSRTKTDAHRPHGKTVARFPGSLSSIVHYSLLIIHFAPPPPENEKLRIKNEQWPYSDSRWVSRDFRCLSVLCSELLAYFQVIYLYFTAKSDSNKTARLYSGQPP